VSERSEDMEISSACPRATRTADISIFLPSPLSARKVVDIFPTRTYIEIMFIREKDRIVFKNNGEIVKELRFSLVLGLSQSELCDLVSVFMKSCAYERLFRGKGKEPARKPYWWERYHPKKDPYWEVVREDPEYPSTARIRKYKHGIFDDNFSPVKQAAHAARREHARQARDRERDYHARICAQILGIEP